MVIGLVVLATSCVLLILFLYRKWSSGVPIRMQLFDAIAKTLFTTTGVRSSSPTKWRTFFGTISGRRALTIATAPFSRIAVGTRNGVFSEDVEVDIGASTVIKVRIYSPEIAIPMEDRLPILIFWHGGGHTMKKNDHEAEDMLCRDFASKGRWLVVSPEYRLAPENPFPAAVHDAYAVAEWVADDSRPLHPALRLGDRGRVVLGGESAGGNLAAVVSLLAAKGVESNGLSTDRSLKFQHQLLVYPPMLVPEPLPASRVAGTSAYVLPKYVSEFFEAAYLGEDKARRQRLMSEDPRVNPGLATLEQLGRMPGTTFVSAEQDPLLDEGRDFAAKLKRAGVAVSEVHYRGMPHGFLCPPPFLRVPSTFKAIEDAVLIVNEALGQ